MLGLHESHNMTILLNELKAKFIFKYIIYYEISFNDFS